MPVIGTPVGGIVTPPTPITPPVTPNPLYTVSPVVTQVYDRYVPTKRRAVVVKQSQTAVIQMPLLNQAGNPIDLSAYALPASEPSEQIVIRFQEALGIRTDVHEATGEVDDQDQGLVAFALPDGVIQCPGVYTCEVAVFDALGRMYLSNTLFVFVERGLFNQFGASAAPYPGAPTVDEIRLSMRDNGPEDNRLLDDYEFDAAELCWALVRAVQFWNTCQPPIGLYYDTVTYPLRDLWLEGVCGQLFEMAANRYMRNDLQYSAGGVAVADQAKWQQYYAAGERRWAGYVAAVRAKKVAVNMGMAMGGLGSSYGVFGSW